MKLINDTDRIRILRPRVLEIDNGLYRGYVDTHERQSGVATLCKSHYCQSAGISRDMAERQAFELAKKISAASRRVGFVTQLICDSLGDSYAGRAELDSVPAFLIRRAPATPSVTRKHLRAVA